MRWATSRRRPGTTRICGASYAWVEVKLQTHTAKGVTDKDFELALKIEEVVCWRPGREGGALEGTPTGDQRFAYIKYDDK